jgi:hypothetical protein
MGRVGWLLVVAGGAAAAAALAYAATGGAAMAAVGSAVGGATPTPPATPGGSGGTLPAGPYKSLGKSASLIDSHTYLTSAPASSGETVSTAVAAFQSAGFTVLGAWGSPPAGWPSDDPLSTSANAVFIAVTAHGGTTNGVDTNTWAAGGATS